MRRSHLTLSSQARGVLQASRERAKARARAEGREPRPWYRFENAEAIEADIYLYDEISWWGITAQDFVQELAGVTASTIRLHINSPGGFVDDGIAIYNALIDHPAEVESRIDGLAASAASVIAMAGDRIVMNRATQMMIHDASALLDILGFFNPAALEGVERDVRAMRNVLDMTSDLIAGIYTDRAGGTVEDWRDRMRAETWYTPETAKAAGLADEIVSGGADKAAARWRDSALFRSFRHTPEHLLQPASDEDRQLTKRDAERALRDAGLPAAAAKAVLAGGWSEIDDDAARDEREAGEFAAFLHQMNRSTA